MMNTLLKRTWLGQEMNSEQSTSKSLLTISTRLLARSAAVVGLLCSLLIPKVVLAAAPVLATEPLSSLNTSVKPNLMFVYDTSFSMGRNYAANYLRENDKQCKIGYKNGDEGKPIITLHRSSTTLTVGVGDWVNVGSKVYLAVPNQPEFSGIYTVQTSGNVQSTCLTGHTVTVPAYTTPAYTTPAVFHPEINTPAYTDPEYTTPAYTDPAYTTGVDPAVYHPAVYHPAVYHPAVYHPAVYQAAYTDPAVDHPAVDHAEYSYYRCDSWSTTSSNRYFTVTVANSGASGTIAPDPNLKDAHYTYQNESNNCSFDADPPNSATKVNGLYYDPTVYYAPPPKPNNTLLSLPSMTNPAAVRTDGLLLDTSGNQTSGTFNLNNWSDVVYCDTPQRPAEFTTDLAWATSARCARNLATKATLDGLSTPLARAASSYYPYQHPEKFRGPTSSFAAVELFAPHEMYQQGQPKGNKNSVVGSRPFAREFSFFKPFYYNIRPIEYCTNNQLTNCKLVSDGAPDATYSVPSYVRYCKDNLNAADVTYAPGAADCQAANTGGVSASDYAYPRFGLFERVDIVSTNNSYPKTVGRTDCAGATCTYADEITNFGNWYAYYRTRIQLMKSAVGRTFKDTGDSKRIGLLTLVNQTSTSPNGGKNYLPISDFTATQKKDWYQSLYNQVPTGDTPSIETLSKVGQIYAGKATTAGLPAGDPVQYSCQPNFTLFTTDGYWTRPVPPTVPGAKNINGGSIGNTDGGATLKPQYDGNSASGTMADTARYYYTTDIRNLSFGNCTGANGLDVCNDNVKPYAGVTLPTQHMTTFTLGLGIKGRYDSEGYTTVVAGPAGPTGSADFNDLIDGDLKWPVPVSNQPSAADDLWHAAVNSAGTYFSAKNPTELISGLQDALNSIDAGASTASAVALSNQTPVAGDNYAYSASYDPNSWIGNLVAKNITLSNIVTPTPVWCAEDVAAPTACTGTMSGKVTANSDTRSIKISNGTALVDFSYGNLSDTQKTYFDNTDPTKRPSQWTSYTAAQKSNAGGTSGGSVGGTNLVKYLRGQSEYDMTASLNSQLYRVRSAILGDIVDSDPTFVGPPRMNYTHDNYSGFKNGPAASRAKMVYVGANDGMLHAFDAISGEEKWAFIPTAVLPNMWKLSDINYKNMHTNFVNAKMTVTDVFNGSAWRTILVSGLGQGGRAYFALDVTNPASPSLLWEYSDANNSELGFSYGKPVITKRKSDGKWLVLITSGYNNISSGTGKGHMFALDAISGALVKQFDTGVGDTTTPSGLAQIAKYTYNPFKKNEAEFVYGGDLLGNVWRFNLNTGVTKHFALLNSGGNPQPVMIEPLTSTSGTSRIVVIGTGKYIETSDLSVANYKQQSLYVMKDDQPDASLPTITRSNMLKMKLSMITAGPNVGGRQADPTNPVMDWTGSSGWYVDWPASGERQYIKSYLDTGALLVPTIVPPTGVCDANGSGWLNIFDLLTGKAFAGNNGVISSRQESPVTGLYFLVDPVNNTIEAGGTRTSLPDKYGNDGESLSQDLTLDPIDLRVGGATGNVKRGVWRELVE